MEEKRFNINGGSIYFSLNKDNKVTLYILNNNGTMVRTIDEFVAKKGGREVIDTNPKDVLRKKQAIMLKYDNLIKEVKGPKFLGSYRRQVEVLKAQKAEEVENYMSIYKKLLNSPNLAFDDYGINVWYDNMEYDHPLGAPDLVTKDGDRIDFIGLETYLGRDEYYKVVLTTFNELKNFEADLQKIVTKQLQQEEAKRNTQEYLNY